MSSLATFRAVDVASQRCGASGARIWRQRDDDWMQACVLIERDFGTEGAGWRSGRGVRSSVVFRRPRRVGPRVRGRWLGWLWLAMLRRYAAALGLI